MKNKMTPQGWLRKFRLALTGLIWAVRSEGSFRVHLPAAFFAILLAQFLRFDTARWIGLVITIGIVLVAELFNTALETLAQAVDDQYNEHIKHALDVASAAVLMSSVVAVVAGVLLYWTPFWNWWLLPTGEVSLGTH
ncbi:diacylglycerol kinase [Blastopirellula marina]|uniref:Diacylglycerol kinase n=1 Tax=Blastopirellula marina TaxID=124 RepID=A0A2S8GQ26_9BACT|nr:diacylglycerol kinase [Blastopirellula marina]PQO46530.1 diacylglycerol kinase [Blastopirellula marina]